MSDRPVSAILAELRASLDISTPVEQSLSDIPSEPAYEIFRKIIEESQAKKLADQSIIDDIISQIGEQSPTQDMVAQIFEARFKDELRYCLAWGKWLQWDNSRWCVDDTAIAFDFAHLVTRRVAARKPAVVTAGFTSGVERFAQTSRTFATKSTTWDPDHWLMNTPAGTLDLQSGKLRPHSRTDHITKCTAISPSRKPHPVFDRFMRDITLEDEALVNYMQRSLGACLSGAVQDHFMLIWIGGGRNGKNTLGDLVTWILGDYAKVVPTETLMAHKSGPQHPTDLANLRGLRMAVSSEVEEGSYFNESRIKSLTGDAAISARFMRQDFFEFPRTHKHLVYGNHRPMLRIVDPALRRRLHLVPFKADFTDDSVCDPLMPHKLHAEAPQILAWLIDGHAMWLEDGLLKKCSAVEKETSDYFDAQSTPQMWVDEYCELDRDCQPSAASDLYRNFAAWKEARGEGALGQTRWGEWMAAHFEKVKKSGIFYRGVKIRSEFTHVGLDKSVNFRA